MMRLHTNVRHVRNINVANVLRSATSDALLQFTTREQAQYQNSFHSRSGKLKQIKGPHLQRRKSHCTYYKNTLNKKICAHTHTHTQANNNNHNTFLQLQRS